jgi:3-hydroxyacyl-[acyl-carrier-protein] dehydratase
MLDNSQLKKILPHAYPFLLLDRVEQYCPGKSLVAIKNITANEWPFSQSTYKLEHYPETLLIEAAAQAALVLYRVNQQHVSVKPAFIGKVKADFFSQIIVGDQLLINVKSLRIVGNGGFSDVEVLVNKERKADMTAFYSIPK